MTSQQVIQRIWDITNKDATGNISVAQWVTFLNAAQDELFTSCIGDQREYRPGMGVAVKSPQLSTRMMNMTAPFKKLAFPVLLNASGVGTYNQGDFAFGPDVWVSSYTNPECGEVALPAYQLEVPMLTDGEWRIRSKPNRYDGASLEFPIFKLLGPTTLQVLPKTVRSVWVEYLRMPKAITCATIQNGTLTLWPDPSAQNQNPEWMDIDVENSLIPIALRMAGVKENQQAWIQYAERMLKQ